MITTIKDDDLAIYKIHPWQILRRGNAPPKMTFAPPSFS